MTQTWYALRTKGRSEKTAEAAIKDLGLDVFLPCETRLRRTRKGKVRVDHPLLPGYLFVGTNPDAKADIYACTRLRSVVDAVRLSSGAAAVIPATFVNGLRASIAAGDFDFTPKRKALAVGCDVRITAGPFQGVIAKLVTCPPEGRASVVIGAGLFAGDLTVDVKSLEPVPSEKKAA